MCKNQKHLDKKDRYKLKRVSSLNYMLTNERFPCFASPSWCLGKMSVATTVRAATKQLSRYHD